MKLGLKIWSLNKNYIKDALKFFEQGLYDYIELYIVPGSKKEFLPLWKQLKIPYIIHAPHSGHHVNLADSEKRKLNQKAFLETQEFADDLNAPKIIVHGGIRGSLEESIAQFRSLNDKRILIENKPYYGINDAGICIGNTPIEIEKMIFETGYGFCYDIGHGFCAANALGKDIFEEMKKYLELDPQMFHLSDGDVRSVLDQHLHFKKGNFDLDQILSFLPKDAIISLETPKDFKDRLSDFKEDLLFLKRKIKF